MRRVTCVLLLCALMSAPVIARALSIHEATRSLRILRACRDEVLGPSKALAAHVESAREDQQWHWGDPTTVARADAIAQRGAELTDEARQLWCDTETDHAFLLYSACAHSSLCADAAAQYIRTGSEPAYRTILSEAAAGIEATKRGNELIPPSRKD